MKGLLSVGILGATIVAFGAGSASAAPFNPPAAAAEAANQAEQVHRRYSRRYYRHRHYYAHRHYPRYYGYRYYDDGYHYGRGPYVYGGVGLPFIGLSIGGGHWHHRHRHPRHW